MVRIRAADPDPPKQVGLVRASVHAAGIVEHLADLDAATEQLLAGGLDVGDDQVQSLGGARCRRGDVLAEDDRAPGARRRKLDRAPVVTVGEVGVEPPPEPPIELLRAVDIRDRDDDDLELHVDSRDARRVVTRFGLRGHSSLLYGLKADSQVPRWELPFFRTDLGRWVARRSWQKLMRKEIRSEVDNG